MAELLGHLLQKSEKVNASIDELVAEVNQFSRQIEKDQLAKAEFEKEAQSLVEATGNTRGRPLFFPYIGTGIGRGAYVELEDGSVKLDLINGIGIHLFGHSHPELIKAALKGALSDAVVQGNLQPNREYHELGKKLVELAQKKSDMKHVWLTTCGSMANENALKICRQKTNAARKIVAMKAAFAGRSTMMGEVTDNPNNRVGQPRYDEVLRIPFYDKNDPKSIENSVNAFKEHLEKHKGDICALTFEPMQGEGGYNVAPREFFIPLLELCKEHGIPVWADEIQTFCRTGQFFAYETLGIGEYIDVCTVAKTAQNGATLYTADLNPKPGLIAGTFAGSSAALSAGHRALEMLENDGYLGPGGKVQKIHDEFIGMLNHLNETTCKGLLRDAGGLGLMVAVTPLDGTKEKMMNLLHVLFKNGLMTFGCGKGPFRLRFLLPAVMESEDIQRAGEIIEKSVQEMA